MSSNLTFSFMGDVPEYIELGYSYKGPRNPKMAEYNSGKGWKPCHTERVTGSGIALPVHSNQISFRGDWRDGSGAYSSMFSHTFETHDGDVDGIIMSGALEYDANNIPSGYLFLFYSCDAIIYMRDNPLPKIKGSIRANMFAGAFCGMRKLTMLPEGFLDMSEMRGDLDNIKDAFNDMCSDMSNVSSSHIFKFGPDMEFNSRSVSNNFYNAWADMRNWTGTVLWGDKVLFNEVIPNVWTEALRGCPNMIGYDKIHNNWKL